MTRKPGTPHSGSKQMARRQLLAALAGLGAGAALPGLAAAGPFNRARLGDAPVLMRRGFVDTPSGQIHYRMAEPANGVLITASPVACFHQSPISSQIYVELMSHLATDRRVYAFDTPGFGESDLPLEPPEVTDYAATMLATFDALELTRVDAIGYHTGASIVTQMAADAPERFGALVLAGVALLNEEERASFFERPWPAPREPGGGHLMIEWERTQTWRGQGQTDASAERAFLEKLSNGETAWWGARAVMRHDLEAALAAVASRMIIINARDDLYEVTPRARALRPDARFITFEDRGFGLIEVEAEALAALARAHFDGA